MEALARRLGGGQKRGGEAVPAGRSEPASTDQAMPLARGGVPARRHVTAWNRAEQGCPSEAGLPT